MTWRYIHIPKTGGISLTSIYGRGNARPTSTWDLQPVTASRKQKDEAHLPSYCFDPDVQLFATFRDPCLRAISLCHHHYLGDLGCSPLPVDVFRRWVRVGCPSDYCPSTRIPWAHPQTTWIASRRVQIIRMPAAGFVAADLRHFYAAIGKDYQTPPWRNAGAYLTQPGSYYDSITADAVYERYRADFELWGRIVDFDLDTPIVVVPAAELTYMRGG